MHKRYEISANYTVEAAFVVPIVLGMIFSMIYMLFILHDKVILHENIRYNVICIDENDGNYKKISNEKTSYEKTSHEKAMDKKAMDKKASDKKASDKKISNDKNLSKNNSKKFLSEKIMTKESVSRNLRIFRVTKLKCNVGKTYIKTEVKAVSKMDIPVIGYFMRKTKKICIKTKYLMVKPETMVRYRKNV